MVCSCFLPCFVWWIFGLVNVFFAGVGSSILAEKFTNKIWLVHFLEIFLFGIEDSAKIFPLSVQ